MRRLCVIKSCCGDNSNFTVVNELHRQNSKPVITSNLKQKIHGISVQEDLELLRDMEEQIKLILIVTGIVTDVPQTFPHP